MRERNKRKTISKSIKRGWCYAGAWLPFVCIVIILCRKITFIGQNTERFKTTRNPTSGFSAETIASFICGLINDNQSGKSLLREAMDVLQHCLDEERLTFSSEQEADHVVTRIRARVG